MIFGRVRALRENGVLGINRRNAEYTLVYNARCLYPLVDDKMLTKNLARAAGIAIPELYCVVEIERQIAALPSLWHEYTDFVIKPARGSGGNGIVVIAGRSKNRYCKASGIFVDESELTYHVSNILGGMYSLGGQPDKALIEYRVKFDPVFEHITHLGVPDIRIIVFLGVPVMAMVRLPTRMSDGRANLHQGAIGVGIDIATGKTLTAVWNNSIVTEHPDTGNTVTDIEVPYWDSMLEIASRCYELTGLGYMGVDLVLDRDKGPLMLEINARPGLNIQIANGRGLLHRLKQIQTDIDRLKTTGEKVLYAKQCF